MENTHDTHYLVQTNDNKFLAPRHQVGNFTQYPNHAEFFYDFDTAKRAAEKVNELNRNNGDPTRARVIRREVYRTYDESFDQFPKE